MQTLSVTRGNTTRLARASQEVPVPPTPHDSDPEGTRITRASRTGPCRKCGYWVWPRGRRSAGGHYYDLGLQSGWDRQPLRVAEHTRCPTQAAVAAGAVQDPVCLRLDGGPRVGEPGFVSWSDRDLAATVAGTGDAPQRWTSAAHVGYAVIPPEWDGAAVRYRAVVVTLAKYPAGRRRRDSGVAIVRPATADEADPVLAWWANVERLRGLSQRAHSELWTPAVTREGQVTTPPSWMGSTERWEFNRRLATLPGVRVPDPVSPMDNTSRYFYLRVRLDSARQLLWLEFGPTQEILGIPLTADREALYALLAETFPNLSAPQP